MAGTLLHITLATRALARARIPEKYIKKITTNPSDYRLGAVLVDLPYYCNLAISGLRSLVGLDLHYNTWGTLLHLRAPGDLGLAILETATKDAGVHLGLGYLTHLAVDAVFHREIQSRVHREADGSRSLDSEHKRIEDEMDLHVHYNSLETPGIGTPYARRMLRFTPDPSWAAHASLAISKIHGNTIEPRILEKWLAQLTRYGYFSSRAWVPWIKTLPEDKGELHTTSLALAKESTNLAARYLETGVAFADKEIGRDQFTELIGNQSMIDGGRSLPPRIPRR